MTEKCISLVIPNYNGSATIGQCLDAAFSARNALYEIVVVDDCSTDNSMDIIRRFPCKSHRLSEHRGAAAARNAGARIATGDYIFFIDSDCLIDGRTMDAVKRAIDKYHGAVIGGTYTPLPYDNDFFSTFQSVFIHHSETKRSEPDYIATHAMIIRSDVFNAMGGFSENFYPILEDVEFSHRLKKHGIRLVMCPDIQVRHIFNFTFWKSLRNAYRKSLYWTMYSLEKGDILADSGTASIGLKTNVVVFFLITLLSLLSLLNGSAFFLLPTPILLASTLIANRKLFVAFFTARGFFFMLRASLYYLFVYPLPIGAGAVIGIIFPRSMHRLGWIR